MIKDFYKFLNPAFQKLFLEYKVEFKPRYGYGKPPHPELYSIIDSNRNLYRGLLNKAMKYKEPLQSIKKRVQKQNSTEPFWDNGFLPGLDMIMIYTLLSEIKPKRFIEIGSGNSTKVAYKSINDNGLNTEIISIDPAPRAEIDMLASKIIREPVENIDCEFLIGMNDKDILFIDNSHRILPNSDSMVFFMEILPKLKKGVTVHIHDIYLQYDYAQFMCDRFYSEQYGLAMYLISDPQRYMPILPNYFISEDQELAGIISPVWEHENLKNVERHGGSFWLTING